MGGGISGVCLLGTAGALRDSGCVAQKEIRGRNLMNIKKQLIGIVVAVAMLAAGGGIANSALADEDPTEFTAGSEYGVLKALELMRDLNELRQAERTPLTPQQIADANPGTEAWRVQANTADGKPVQELDVNWDLMKWAQTRADELAAQGEITHDNMYNGVPDWYVHTKDDHNLAHSDKYVWVQQGNYRYGSQYYGPEALASAGRSFGYNAVDMWAAELQTGAQGYGHYLTEVSPLADIAGIGVAVKDGVIYTVLEIGNNYLNKGQTQTVEEALAERTPQPEPEPVNAYLSSTTLTVASTNTGDISNDLKAITATIVYNDGTKVENQPVTWNTLTDEQLSIIKSRDGGQLTVEGMVAGRPVGLRVTVTPATVTSAKAKQDRFTTPAGISLTQDDLNPVTVTWSNGDTTEEDYAWDLENVDFSKPTAEPLELVGRNGSSTVHSSIQVTDAMFDHLESTDLGLVETKTNIDPTDKLNALKATLVYSDGSERSVDVTWEPIDPANYASDKAGSTFEVKGTVSVDGQDLPVSATVAVQARMITNIQLSQHELTIESGEDPAGKLATITATIAYDNGESEVVSVDWPKISEDVYGAREGGEEIIGGYVNGVYEMQLTLRIKPATLTSVETALSDITVTEGTDPELPQTVDVEYSNGDQDVLAVTWSTDNVDFSKVGDYPLSGTIAGWPEPATLTVHVVRASVVDVTVPEAVTVASGITEDKVMQLLPVTVIATMSNNTTVDVPVAWNALSADQKAMLQSREGGEFTLTGAVQGSDKTVSIKVTVQPAVATAAGFGEDGVDTAQVTMESGADAAALGLPKSATVRWSNGDETDEAVEWSEPSAEQLSILSARRGGSFGIQGTVAGLVVHAVVTVNHAEAEKIVDSVDFKNGVATVSTDPTVLPQLPQSADVRWSNGDVTTEKVIWNTVDASQVADEGTTFEVNGSVSIEMEVLTDSVTKDGSLTPGLELGTYTATLPVTAKVMVNNVTEQLEDAVADAGELNPDDYMADSWKVVAEAIERANGVLNAEDASIADKIAARDRLTAALGQLQSKRPTTSDGDSQQSSSERDAGQKHSQGNDQTSKVPNTGSAVVWIAVAAVVLLAVAGAIAVVMRRRKD